MLFKISVSNIRKSLRDYAIYFFTLVIGVSIFYVFNAIGTQTVYMNVSKNTREIIELLNNLLSGVSVFVSIVLGLLIVYASRFLMKRRNKEFALYLTLGMGKGKISAILLMETLIIGIGSLVVGLLIGSGLSQVMSALVANLFEADMSSYKFTISTEAVLKTIAYFGIMYVVLMLFNSVMISRCKLIDLMQSGKKSEKQRLKNPVICTVIFILATVALSYAYYQVTHNGINLSGNAIIRMMVIGAVSTFFIFWSVSGLLLRIITSMKNVYFGSLNCFTFRQISSKINTMVMSMTVICLMLFVTICTLASAFSIRNSMNANLKELCPADCEIYYKKYAEDGESVIPADIAEAYEQYGYDITEGFSEYVHFHSYSTEEFKFADFAGEEQLKILQERYTYLMDDIEEEIIRLSDYNKLMDLYGKEPLELQEGEYILLCDFPSIIEMRDDILAEDREITIFGNTLKPKYRECQNGFIEISAQHLNGGLFVVPDDAVDETGAKEDYFLGNYAADTKEEKEAIEAKVQKNCSKVIKKMFSDDKSGHNVNMVVLNTKMDIAESTIGLGALVSLLGLYIGLVFLISCGAILALKELSENVDSIQRYVMLRKIGADENDISKSLFRQSGIFFLLPLLLAGIHSIFGMKVSKFILESFGTENLMVSIISTSAIILLIYGGYFLITYFCSKSIIRDRR